MHVKVRSISSPTKRQALAAVSVEINFGEGERIVVADLRILKNINGEIWVAYPSRNIDGVQNQVVFCSNPVRLAIDGVVIPAYEEWAESQAQTAQHAQNTEAGNGNR